MATNTVLQTQARTQQDVLDMDKANRLWDSMNYTYGVARQDLEKQYDRAFSQQDNAALKRGMQRSSYNNQTLANLRQAGLDAQQKNWNEQIADYENRLIDQENTDWTHAFQERSFDEGVRQYNQNFEYQQGRDAVADSQHGQGVAQGYVSAIIANGQMPTDDLLAQAGLSRADAQKMIAQAAPAAGGGGGGGGSRSGNGSTGGKNGNGTGGDTTGATGATAWDQFYGNLYNSEGLSIDYNRLNNLAGDNRNTFPVWRPVENKKSSTSKTNMVR